MTRAVRRIAAPPSAVYEALTTAADVQRWMVPDDMSSEVHAFDAREGGAFRISLTYDDPSAAGKTGGATDTFSGRFVRLVPGREVVQAISFESADASMAGEMTISYLLEPTDDGATTVVTGLHEGLPPGVSEADNELGWSMSMDNLARLVEARQSS